MRTYKEVAENVLRARDEYLAKKKRRNNMIKKISVTALAVLMFCGAGAGLAYMLNGNSTNMVDGTKETAAAGQTIMLNGVDLTAIDQDEAKYKEWNPEGIYTAYRDDTGLIYYADQDGNFRVIVNDTTQKTNEDADPEKMADRLLNIVGQDTGRNGTYGAWSGDGSSIRFKLAKRTDFGEIILADLLFDSDGSFISGRFNSDDHSQDKAVKAGEIIFGSFDKGPESFIYPDDYAGEYIDADNKLHLMITTEDAKDRYALLLKDYADIVVYEIVEYSFNDLMAEAEEIVSGLPINAWVSYGVDTDANMAHIAITVDGETLVTEKYDPEYDKFSNRYVYNGHIAFEFGFTQAVVE